MVSKTEISQGEQVYGSNTVLSKLDMDQEEYIQLEIDRLRAAVLAFDAGFPRRWLCKHGGLVCSGVKAKEYKELAIEYRTLKQTAVDLLRS
jgi:hypothetical protein